MRVSVFGLGYVGTISTGCFANDDLDVIGVDVNPIKVDMVNAGRSPVVEPEIGDLISQGVETGRLRATTDAAEAVAQTDVSVVSVGTPSNANGSLSLSAVESVSEEIGRGIAKKDGRHLVVVRSTMLPGSVRAVVVPALERASGRELGTGFGVAYNPEFLREGRSVRDHYDPPFVLVGSWAACDGDLASELYDKVETEKCHVTIESAEMVKYVCNAFHAVKITFANEVGMLAQACGVDSAAVMDLVCKDKKLNISPAYLQPGFAFGGSCLPKDLRALLYRAKMADVELPMTQSVLSSNRLQIDRAIDGVLIRKRRRVGMLGLSFKAGTDDLRESPLVQLAEALIGKGLDVRIFDANVSLARLIGANKQYIEEQIPHLAALLSPDLESVVEHAEVLVVGHGTADSRRLPTLCRSGQTVIDLVGMKGLAGVDGIDYQGIVW